MGSRRARPPNTSYVGPPERPQVKLAGSGGGADIAILSRRWVTLMTHEKRRLVERVSFVTSPGHGDGTSGWRARHGLQGGGPATIITTLCVFRFPPEGGAAYLDSVHPGHTMEEVRAATGWRGGEPSDLPATSAPTPGEPRETRAPTAHSQRPSSTRN